MSELFILILNSTLYLLFAIYALKKHNNILATIVSVWLVASIISIFYFLNPFNDLTHKISIIPFIYLFVCLAIGLIPFHVYNEKTVKKNTLICNKNLFYFVIWILVLCSIEPFFESLIRIGTKGIGNLGKVYEEERYMSNFDVRGYFTPIGKILFSVVDYFKFVSMPFLFIYLAIGRRNKIIIIGLLIAILNPLLNNLANGQRFYFIILLYTTIFNFILFNKLLPSQLKKNIFKYFLLLSVALGTVFFIISLSRFGKGSSYDMEGYGTTYQFLRYAGEAFCNFNSEAFWVTNYIGGKNSFVGFYTYFLNDGMSITQQNSITGIVTNNFHTYIGNFYIDFGPYLTVFIITFMSIIFFLIAKTIKSRLKVGTILILSLYSNIFLLGTTYFVYQNGFIHMIWTVVLSIVFNVITSRRDVLNRISKKKITVKVL